MPQRICTEPFTTMRTVDLPGATGTGALSMSAEAFMAIMRGAP